jgi:isopenicillin N synthase-like dioxygenase
MPPESKDTTIPVIDLSNPSDETARQVLDAASTHGFLFIKNDGVTIPPADIDEMFKLASHPPNSTQTRIRRTG